MSTFTPIEFEATAANCPWCGAFAQLTWYHASKFELGRSSSGASSVNNHHFSECHHCREITIWRNYNMIFPLSGNVPIANVDLPDEIKADYNEAANIVNLSPRGSVAMLRLAIQKLCKALGEKGENINTDIKNLVAKGLPPIMQQALDSVRVIGNNAVHPGQIELTDDTTTAYKLFAFVNIIADTLITQPRQIAEFYTEVVPEKDKLAIQKRDGVA